MTIVEALQLALNHHRANQLDQAESLYRQILAAVPDQPDALHFLGIVYRQKGLLSQSLQLIQRSLAIRPDEIGPMINLAQTYKELGQLQLAAETFRKVIEKKPPNIADLYNNLGNIHKLLGQPDQAIEAYRNAVSINPNYAQAWYNMGISFQDQSLHQQAIDAYQKALAISPNLALAHSNLGNSLQTLGQIDQAIDAYHKALSINPNLPQPNNNLANAYSAVGQFDKALHYCQIALQIDPENPEILSTFGNIRRDLDQIKEAIVLYQKALNLNPNLPITHNNLGYCQKLLGLLDEAVQSYKSALRLIPNNPDFHNNLGNAYKNQGLIDLAIECYNKAISINPDNPAYHSNLIMLLNYSIRHSPEQIFREERLWNTRHASTSTSTPASTSTPTPTPTPAKTPSIDPDPNRKLRIGFVSPDFREHPVSRFIIPLLAHLDPNQFEVHAYNDLLKSDSVTASIRALVPHWRETYSINTSNFIDLIRTDRIDILIDLASHSGGNRLPAFALKPAPVQISWLAYCGSTGLDAMDYRISDPHMDPPGMFDQYYSEKTLLLPDCYWCYSPPPSAPEPRFPDSPDPVLGCFNNFCKINDVVLSLWARILKLLPKATLMLYSQEGTHRNMTLTQFHKLGVDHSRIRFNHHIPPKDYYAMHREVHIMLDPFPFNGGTTTCDALYMGVPVVTRIYDRAVGRAGLSLLTQVGLSDLAADSDDAYIQTALQLVQNTPRLRNLRENLRTTMLASPLMNAPRFAKNFAALLRQTWPPK